MIKKSTRKTVSLLCGLFSCLLVFLYGCAGAKDPRRHNGEKGSYTIERHKAGDRDSAYLYAEIYDQRGRRDFRLCDLWVNGIRYECNSSGKLQVSLAPGKYTLKARAMGFAPLSHIIKIKRGENVTVLYNLAYQKHRRHPEKHRSPLP